MSALVDISGVKAGCIWLCVREESLGDLDLKDTEPTSVLDTSGIVGIGGGARDDTCRVTGAAGRVVVLDESAEDVRWTPDWGLGA